MWESFPPPSELIDLVPRQKYFHRIPRATSSQEPVGQKQRPQELSTYLVPGSWFLNAIPQEQETWAPYIPILGREGTKWAWTSYCPRKQGSTQTQMEACRKDTGANWKGLPLAQSGTIWVSKRIIIMDWQTELQKNSMSHSDTQRKGWRRESASLQKNDS